MGWTWLEGPPFDVAFKDFQGEAEREVEMDRRTPLIENVARQIAEQKRTKEQDGFLRQSQVEEIGYCGRDEYDSPEEEYRHALNQKLADAREQAEEETLVQELATLGARMMRPYEHWNEDEAYMAYAERDR